MVSLSPLLVCVVVAALLFDFVNGWNDSANAIATIVSTRVLSPLKAVGLAAVLNLVGAFSGTAVASTITKGLVNTSHPSLTPDMVVVIVLAAMLGAMFWAAWMTILGLPISGSHSLIGGLCGAAVAAGGVHVLIAPGILKVLI
ncbi:MAG: inorganic phosphate transporter, partial [Deltaproteobacteria bacterium]|nr:inorganic phosphate transporter [Deltaproteobacteria bacterium]